MTDTPTPRTDIDDPEQVDRIRRLWARLDYQEALIDKLERETAELRQQLDLFTRLAPNKAESLVKMYHELGATKAQLAAENIKMQEVLVASANVLKAKRKAREDENAYWDERALTAETRADGESNARKEMDTRWQVQFDRAESAERRLAEVEQDARRYRWLRDRIEIREQEAMSGKRKPGLWIAMGMTFLDANTIRKSDHVRKKAAELDAAIDAAIKESAAQEKEK